MQEPSALGRAVLLVRDLRKRCPWDGAQTPETLRPYLVEEVLELDHALGQGDPGAIRDELGDLLLHLAFQIVLGEESNRFGVEDVVSAMERKMWRRHPHLFPAPRTTPAEGAAEAAGAGGVAGAGEAAGRPDSHGSWERTKVAERGADGPGVLDGLPPNLPVLIMAFRLQERAAGVGFDWPDASGPAEKVREELAELEKETQPGHAADRGRVEHELGDLLFAAVNLARKLDCDPRAALEQANQRFVARFRGMEHLAGQRGIRIGYAGLDQLDQLWEESKALGPG
ncbi:MAG: nucleoside triphosphate pyrophosphohydrolase [Gemmatimonadetes bacterium]|nr:nucleoside triphosphate pyrophosphohydrolase [Gemmatimonadota bacterium]